MKKNVFETARSEIDAGVLANNVKRAKDLMTQLDNAKAVVRNVERELEALQFEMEADI